MDESFSLKANINHVERKITKCIGILIIGRYILMINALTLPCFLHP